MYAGNNESSSSSLHPRRTHCVASVHFSKNVLHHEENSEPAVKTTTGKPRAAVERKKESPQGLNSENPKDLGLKATMFHGTNI